MADLSSTGQTCDRCRVAAAAVLWLNPDHDLAFCAHHSREYHAALVAAGFDAYELAMPTVRDMVTSPIPG